MGTEIRTGQFSEQTIRQAQADCRRAMIRGRFCPDRIEVLQLRCVDERLETESHFGSQLWYFEGEGVDEREKRRLVFGVIEYSTQFGLNELLDDGVFDSEHQRERVRYRYEGEVIRPSWRQPAHRWLAIGVIAVATIWMLYVMMVTLSL